MSARQRARDRLRQPAGSCDRCGCARAYHSWGRGLICPGCGADWPMEGGGR